MATILVFPLPELGHILPTLALSQSLICAGHTVVYLTANHLRGPIQAVGAEVVLIAPGDKTGESSGSSFWYRSVLHYGMDPRASRLQSLLGDLLRTRHFDLVLCDFILAPAYSQSVVKLLGADRCVKFSTALFHWRECSPKKSDLPTIVFCPEDFELPQFRDRSGKVFYVEAGLAPVWDQRTDDLILDPASPLVLATFGSQSVRYQAVDRYLQLIVRTAAACPALQFIVASDRFDTSRHLLDSSSPPNLQWRRRIPQRLLMARASVLITHGGLGSIKEAICEATPMLVLPMLHDQPYNAMRVRQLGLGDALFEESPTLQSLESSVQRAVDGTFTESLHRMRAKFLALERARLSHLLISNRLIGMANR